MAFKIECLQDQGILHTYFENRTAVNSHEEVRHLRDRLLHALLECPADPVWVLSLDNLEVSDQWLVAFGGLFQFVQSEGVRRVIAYTNLPTARRLWEKHLNHEMRLNSDAVPELWGSQQEAFQRAHEWMGVS